MARNHDIDDEQPAMEPKELVIFKLVLRFLFTVIVKGFQKLSIAFLSLIEGLSMRGTEQDDVTNFDQLSANWWEPNGPMKLLHKLNTLRVPMVVDGLIKAGKLDRKQRHTTDSLKGLTILDVGCGGGIYTEALAKLHAKVVGIDPAKHLIEVAKAHVAKQPELQERCHYEEVSMEEHAPKHVGKYDVVVLSETIEHVVDKSTLLKNVAMVLKPGGSVFVTTWNKTTWAWLLAVVVLENIMKRLPRGSHDYDKFIGIEDLEEMLAGYNCQPFELRPFYLKFWEDEWIWVPFKGMSYAVHAIKE